tara:strand:- start:427 stop:639 length:213 start_codon:yes stop_codon:yes gene_type:complete
MNNNNISQHYYKKFIDDNDCIKIPKKYKYTKNLISNKKIMLLNYDSIHAHKNMRKFGNDWKNYNLNIYIK